MCNNEFQSSERQGKTLVTEVNGVKYVIYVKAEFTL